MNEIELGKKVLDCVTSFYIILAKCSLHSYSSRWSESQNCCFEVAFIVSGTLFLAQLARCTFEVGNFFQGSILFAEIDNLF